MGIISKLIGAGTKAMAKKKKGGEAVSRVLKSKATSKAKASRALEKAKRQVSILRSADKPDKKKIILAEDKVKALQLSVSTKTKKKGSAKSYLTTDPIKRERYSTSSKVFDAVKKLRK